MQVLVCIIDSNGLYIHIHSMTKTAVPSSRQHNSPSSPDHVRGKSKCHEADSAPTSFLCRTIGETFLRSREMPNDLVALIG
jgi:hypothetical protein